MLLEYKSWKTPTKEMLTIRNRMYLDASKDKLCLVNGVRAGLHLLAIKEQTNYKCILSIYDSDDENTEKEYSFDTFTDFINGLQELHNFLLDTHNTNYIDKMTDMFLSIQRLNRKD